MPHAVFVTSYPCPASTAQAIRVQSLAEAVADLPDWEVTLVVPIDSSDTKKSTDEFHPYINLVRCSRLRYDKSNFLARGLGELNQACRLLRAANKRGGDLLIVSVPSVFLLLSLLLPGRSQKIVDIRDLVWEYLLLSRGMSRWAGLAIRHLARHLLKRAVAISTTNEHEAGRIEEETSISPIVTRNGISQRRFDQMKRISAPTSQGKPYHIVYIGNIGLAQELGTLLDAVGGDNRYHVTLVGSGNDLYRLKERIEKKSLGNVTTTDSLPWSETLPYLKSADCFFGQIGLAYKTAIPSKIFEYACACRPTIFCAPRDGAAWDILGSFKGFARLPPGDPENLKEIIMQKQTAPLLTQDEIDQNRKIVVQNYLREEQAYIFANAIQQNHARHE